MAKTVFDLHLQKHKEEITGRDPPNDLPINTSISLKKDKKFSQFAQKGSEVLMKVKTIFPFDFFPDILSIDPVKINFTHKIFFFSSFTESIPITDITNVVVEESVIFALLRISFISYPTRQIYIKPLWKSDAERARDIISGLIVTSRQHIDVSVPDTQTFEQVGQSHT